MEPILLLYLMPENFTHQLWSTSMQLTLTGKIV